MTVRDWTDQLRVRPPRSILFVCTGNTCRSAMAAAWLRARLAGRGRGDIEVESAGTAAFGGEPMPPQAEFALFREGVDSSGCAAHRSRSVDGELLRRADVVLVMTRAHLEHLRRRFPEYAGKVHLLTELIGSRADISDPFGGDSEEYIRCLDQMKPGLQRLLDICTGAEMEREGRGGSRADL